MNIITVSDVEAFCETCTFFKIIYSHFQSLYEQNTLRLRLLEESAHHFFRDIQYVLISFLMLQVCKITDPANSQNRENLTIKFFQNYTDLSANSIKADKLKTLSLEMHNFRDKVVTARNRRISHFDRDTALNDLDLGGFKYGEFEIFIKNLQEFINIIHDHYVGGPYDLGSYSETFELINSLRKAKYFDALFENHETKSLCIKARLQSDFREA